jgi:hypothetical protein
MDPPHTSPPTSFSLPPFVPTLPASDLESGTPYTFVCKPVDGQVIEECVEPIEYCGDGIINGNEECDWANDPNCLIGCTYGEEGCIRLIPTGEDGLCLTGQSAPDPDVAGSDITSVIVQP